MREAGRTGSERRAVSLHFDMRITAPEVVAWPS